MRRVFYFISLSDTEDPIEEGPVFGPNLYHGQIKDIMDQVKV